MAPLRILIVGASIAGPSLASFLLLSKPDEPASSLPHLTLLERSSTLRTTGQNIDVRGAGNAILADLGLLEEVKSNTTHEKGVQFVDTYNRIWAQLDADTTGETSTPTADIEILRGKFAEILVRKMREISQDVEVNGGLGVEEIWGDHLESLEQNEGKVTVTFASGKRREFDIVVGADGLHSSTRKLAWGTDRSENQIKRLGMYGAFFSIPRAETDTLYRRWYHASGRRGVMVRPDDTGEKTTVLMFVINEEDERLRKAAGRDNIDAQKALMAEYYADAGWESKRIVEAMSKTNDFYYDMVGQVKLDHYSKGRVVLLGDAGYCASPISGMGTTLALSGAYNLAGCLARNAGNLQAALDQYEEKMRPVVERAQRLAPGMPYLMNPETAWGVWILNAVMWVITTTGITSLLFKLGAGPPAHMVPIEEYGFRKLSGGKVKQKSCLI